MKKIFAILSFSLAIGFLISGCGSSSSSSTPATSVGLSMPSNISPVPTTSTAVAASKLAKGASLGSLLSGLATDPGTDYSNATTHKHVEEHVLSQFQIINTILDAMSQTHFADMANLGKGPYKSMIAWKEDNGGGGPQGGGQQKKLQPWIVDSSMIVENGKNVNQVLAWIQDSQQGMPVVIRVKVKIYASPTLKTDGSYQDYGVWTLNAVFDNNPNMYFSAATSIGPSGEAIVKFHEHTKPGQEVKAILNTSNGSGFGQISFPDYSSCQSPNCVPTTINAKYSYDSSTVGLVTTDGINTTGPSFRNRTSTTDVTMFYGLYDSVTGADVLKTKNFGFPLKYTVNGVDNYVYYGSWQGRHSLWANGGSVPVGTTLTRMDLGPNQPAETYTVTNRSNFSGSLTKRTLVASNLSNILNLPVSTWTNMSTTMKYTGTTWCNVAPGTANCSSITDLSTLVADPKNPNQFISIYGTLNTTTGNFVYDPTPNTGGFFAATQGPNGTWTKTGSAITPVTNNQLWVNIGGSIYIEYTNKPSTNGYQSGSPIWVKKKLTAFDQQTWTPTFDDTQDTVYSIASGQQYYLMNQGTNFVLTTGVNATFQIEVQTVANPINATTFTGNGTIFTPQWSNGYGTNYTFVTSSSDPRYLNLVYNTVDHNDPSLATAKAGDIVTTGIYGLIANDGTQYNWDYATAQNPYGLLTYLVGPSPGTGYKLLDDPISLKSFTVTNASGSITVSPMYSGWMSGLPDIYSSLRLTNWVMTSDLQTKVYNIPDKTAVDDAVDSTKHYLIRPLEISEFLNPISPYTGSLNPATVVADLTTVPVLDSTGIIPDMATMPSITTVKYSEGKLLQ